MMAVFTLSSCSEDSNETIEFENWQAKNEQSFADTLDYAKQHISQGNLSIYKPINFFSISIGIQTT